MATKTKDALTSFNEVDRTLCEIGISETRIESLTADMNKEILLIKEKYEKSIKPLQDKIKIKEKLISQFCKSNKSEFSKQRTKKLSFGEVGFRMGKMALALINKKYTWDRAAESLSKMFSLKYVKIETTLKKDEVIEAFAKGHLMKKHLLHVVLK